VATARRGARSRSQSVISQSLALTPVGKKSIHHMDFETLLEVNRDVVALTGEAHSYAPADGQKLSNLIKEVEMRADNQEFKEAVAEKAALLIFRVASGQYFHAGNQRTALVAGLAFLAKNGYSLNLQDEELVSTVDKAGIAAADLDDLYDIIMEKFAKSKVERRGWDTVVKGVVESNKDFLTRLSS
jgi:death-on-curing family protein